MLINQKFDENNPFLVIICLLPDSPNSPGTPGKSFLLPGFPVFPFPGEFGIPKNKTI